MHNIQKQILNALSSTKRARYSEIKPRDIDGNLFTYHLNSLIRSGYVRKIANTKRGHEGQRLSDKSQNKFYSLTATGKHYVDRLSFDTLSPRIQPKIVTLMVIERSSQVNNTKTKKPRSSEYLFYKRNKAPFIGHFGFPYGKIHLEERLQEAATRELREKTGLNTKLAHRGDVYITVHDETELVSHMLCHIFFGKYEDSRRSSAQNTVMRENCFFSKISDIPKGQLIPGVQQIVKLLTEHPREHFFAELFLNAAED